MVSAFLEGQSLAQAVEEKKLFLVNHKIVEGLPVTNEENEVYKVEIIIIIYIFF